MRIMKPQLRNSNWRPGAVEAQILTREKNSPAAASLHFARVVPSVKPRVLAAS
jgi:hypothetical protein